VTYTAAGAASPGATPANPNGTFFIGESGNYVLMIEGGFEMGINVQSVAAWQ
jgi:hypothetical protein